MPFGNEKDFKMKYSVYLPLVLIAGTCASEDVCSKPPYMSLSPVAEFPEAKSYCAAKFGSQKTTSATIPTPSNTLTVVQLKKSTLMTVVTISGGLPRTTSVASTLSTSTKPKSERLASLSALAANVAKTFCSCYFSRSSTVS